MSGKTTKRLRRQAYHLTTDLDGGIIRLPSGAMRHKNGTYKRIYVDLKKGHK
jgi:hypothetical protein